MVGTGLLGPMVRVRGRGRDRGGAGVVRGWCAAGDLGGAGPGTGVGPGRGQGVGPGRGPVRCGHPVLRRRGRVRPPRAPAAGPVGGGRARRAADGPGVRGAAACLLAGEGVGQPNPGSRAPEVARAPHVRPRPPGHPGGGPRGHRGLRQRGRRGRPPGPLPLLGPPGRRGGATRRRRHDGRRRLRPLPGRPGRQGPPRRQPPQEGRLPLRPGPRHRPGARPEAGPRPRPRRSARPGTRRPAARPAHPGAPPDRPGRAHPGGPAGAHPDPRHPGPRTPETDTRAPGPGAHPGGAVLVGPRGPAGRRARRPGCSATNRRRRRAARCDGHGCPTCRVRVPGSSGTRPGPFRAASRTMGLCWK